MTLSQATGLRQTSMKRVFFSCVTTLLCVIIKSLSFVPGVILGISVGYRFAEFARKSVCINRPEQNTSNIKDRNIYDLPVIILSHAPGGQLSTFTSHIFSLLGLVWSH